MRIHALIAATVYVLIFMISAPGRSFAQSSYGIDETSDPHRVLTVRRHRSAVDPLSIYNPAPYDADADASDPFSTCISGCDIDVIFRALTGRPDEGWKR